MIIDRFRRAARDESGFGAIETAIITPAVLLVLLLLVAAGRVAKANGSVDEAAYAAARAASISRSAGDARSAAQSVAASTLSQHGLTCSPKTVTVDTSGFAVAVGTTATVKVKISCGVPLADLVLPGLGGSRQVSGSASSVLDTYRERTLRFITPERGEPHGRTA